jgi:hypothetical protein
VRRRVRCLRTEPGRLGRAAAFLAAGLFLSGCAAKPLPYSGPIDIRSLEVTIKEAPPGEVYYNRRKPPGVLGYLGTAAFMGSTIYRSWADSEKTQEVSSPLRVINPNEEVVTTFVRALREAGVFRRVDVRRPAEAASLPAEAAIYDAYIELMVDRWGLTYATEGKLSAEVVVEGRMRPSRGDENLLWRRRVVETDGARLEMDALASNQPAAKEALLRTLRAAGADLARDLLKPMKPLQQRDLIPPPGM